MATLSAARYGKDNVRVYKVHRHEDGTQDVVEMTVCTLLEGDIAASYTKADNANVVATDTQKQTVYIMAKLHPVNPPELFASILGQHYLDTYSWMTAAHINIKVHRWTRLNVDGKPHPHSFMRDGEEKRTVELVAKRGSFSIRSGIDELLVLKSTGSQFWGYHKDEYTKLPETWDRILSTEVQAIWQWRDFKSLEEVKGSVEVFDKGWSAARQITLDTFAKEDSPSVQNTMYLMSEQILAAVPMVDAVEYSLPNKHYFEIGKTAHSSRRLCRYANNACRSQLVQCTPESRQGCRSLRTAERSKRSDQVHCDEARCFIEIIKLDQIAILSVYLLPVLSPNAREHFNHR